MNHGPSMLLTRLAKAPVGFPMTPVAREFATQAYVTVKREHPEDAERFISRVGELLAGGRIKLGLARELRMIGQAWSGVHANRLAATEFDAVRERVEELEGQIRGSWRKAAS